MATILAGGGNSGPQGKGAAWQARLVSSDFARLAPDDDQQLGQAGVSVQNHSYGVAIENYYGLDAVDYDRQCRQLPTLLHVFSARQRRARWPAPAAPTRALRASPTSPGSLRCRRTR